MAGLCIAPAAGTLMVRALVGATDCNVQALVKAGYGGLMQGSGLISAALTGMLTIYVAMVGYRLMLGRGAGTVTDFALTAVKIGAVLALATQWSVYQTLVYRVLFDGPQQIADGVLRGLHAGVTPHGVLDGLQHAFDVLTAPPPQAGPLAQAANPVTGLPPLSAAAQALPGMDAAAGAQAAAQNTAAAAPAAQPGMSQGAIDAIVMTAAAAILMLSTLGVLLASKIVLALLLALGPVFIALLLFQSTRGLFEGWLRASLGVALAPLTVTLASAVALTLIEPSLQQIEALRQTQASTQNAAFGVLILALVTAVVAASLLAAGGVVAQGFRLPTPRRPARSTDAAPAARAGDLITVLPRAQRTAASMVIVDRRSASTSVSSATSDRRTTLAGSPGPDSAVQTRLGQGSRRTANPRSARSGARSLP